MKNGAISSAKKLMQDFKKTKETREHTYNGGSQSWIQCRVQGWIERWRLQYNIVWYRTKTILDHEHVARIKEN